MLHLIVNGDDFGINEKVNEAILRSFKNGILCSTSLMANGKSFEGAIKIIKSNPELDIGVHLTLVGEKPILSNDKTPSLLDENGFFHKNVINFSTKYFANKVSLEEVKMEFTAQIEKILNHVSNISHIDSHQDVHILPKILDITIEVAKNYNIKFIRIPKEKLKKYMFYDLKSIDRLPQMIVRNYFCSKAKKKKSFSTDYFNGFYFGGKLSKQNLLTLIKNLPADGVCELMCHPGLSYNSTDYSHWNYQQVEEMLALVDMEVAEAILKRNIEITSFKNLS